MYRFNVVELAITGHKYFNLNTTNVSVQCSKLAQTHSKKDRFKYNKCIGSM